MKIPNSKAWFDEVEVDLARAALLGENYIGGFYTREFEIRCSAFMGAGYCIAVNSAASGLFLFAHLLSLRPGDEIIIPAFGSVAPANAVEFYGARPVFCDIDLRTFTIDPAELLKKITPRTRAVFVTHAFGLCAPMMEIREIAEKYNLLIVEDCGGGFGSRVNEIHCGLMSAGGVFSLDPLSSVVTSEGGLIITNNEMVAAKILTLREYGILPARPTEDDSLPAELNYIDIGFNLRLSDLQAAVGLGQIQKLPSALAIRKRLAWEYETRLDPIPWLTPPLIPQGMDHVFQRHHCLFRLADAEKALAAKDCYLLDGFYEQKKLIIAYLLARGVDIRPGGVAIPAQTFFKLKYRFEPMDFPNAYAADRLGMCLPFFPSITEEEKDYFFNQLAAIQEENIQ